MYRIQEQINEKLIIHDTLHVYVNGYLPFYIDPDS